MLLAVLQRLVEQGDSLVVIEHNLEVLKCADWIIDLGPEAEREGGRVVAAGTPETIAETPGSHTGKFLKPKLASRKSGARIRETPAVYRNGNTRALRRLDAMPQAIQIRGARHHNLKNISVDIALNEMTVVTGLSGSGKSTLAFDLLFAEGQRRYLDSLNAYARQFVEQLERPDVDSITGIPPSVAIEQRVTRGGRKSTVATITEIFQFVRLLYAKLGQARDPETDEPAIRQTPAEILTRLEKAARRQELRVLVPLIKGRKGFHTEVAKLGGEKRLSVAARRWKMDRAGQVQGSRPLCGAHDQRRAWPLQSKKQSAADRRRLIDVGARALGRGTALRPRCAWARNRLQHAAFLSRVRAGRLTSLEPRLCSPSILGAWLVS